jgi:hypothetical protein
MQKLCKSYAKSMQKTYGARAKRMQTGFGEKSHQPTAGLEKKWRKNGEKMGTCLHWMENPLKRGERRKET